MGPILGGIKLDANMQIIKVYSWGISLSFRAWSLGWLNIMTPVKDKGGKKLQLVALEPWKKYEKTCSPMGYLGYICLGL